MTGRICYLCETCSHAQLIESVATHEKSMNMANERGKKCT